MMNFKHRNKLCVVFCIEIFKVRNMLEVVCINLAVVNHHVRLYIIVFG